MEIESTSRKPTTRRYTPEERAQAVRLVRQLRKELGTSQGMFIAAVWVVGFAAGLVGIEPYDMDTPVRKWMGLGHEADGTLGSLALTDDTRHSIAAIWSEVRVS